MLCKYEIRIIIRILKIHEPFTRTSELVFNSAHWSLQFEETCYFYSLK